VVGPEATAIKFFIHADLASQHSEFFAAALKKGWKEAEERVIRLPDLPNDSAEMFQDFHSFLYTGRIYSGNESETNKPGYDKEWRRPELSWILGEVLLSAAFKDAVVDAIIHKVVVTQSYPTNMYRKIYSHSFDSSPIRKLMVDIVVHGCNEKYLENVDTNADPAIKAEFLKDVAIALFKVKALFKK
jgi:hypothetical protein